MTRRALLAALASLPFVGRSFVQRPPMTPERLVLAWNKSVTLTRAPLVQTHVLRDANGKRSTIHFTKDRATGRWYEFMRVTQDDQL
jgi:hypothetical protein